MVKSNKRYRALNSTVGLTSAEASSRLKQFGLNRITKKEQHPWWKILIRQLKSPIVYLLVFASATSFYLEEGLDGIAILVVIVINTLIGFYMEFQADRSMRSLQNLSVVPSKVFRDGKLQELNSEEIVPGDVLYLEAGDMVSADGEVSRSSRLSVNESALTGESVPVEKERVRQGDSTPLKNLGRVFKGTFITNGNAYVTVAATGMQTELGKIAALIQKADQAVTPLEIKLEVFSNKLIKITVALVFIVFGIGWSMGHNLLKMLNTSIALAVAAIPEGLPIVATLGLARGMLKMAKHNVIVKKLSAVETLGGTTVICTDKTGTLTENKMTVGEAILADAPENEERFLEACVLCNTATIDDNGKGVGDPLEVALLDYVAGKTSISIIRNSYRQIEEEPFSSETKRMITLVESESRYFTFSKGAVESILPMTRLSDHTRSKILSDSDLLAGKGNKVIALAYKQHNTEVIARRDLTLLGIVGLVDPLRSDVPAAIAECRAAGVRVVMVTGDDPNTAREIGRQLGMDNTENVITGAKMKAFTDLSDSEKDEWVNTSIFARVTPAQKLDLVGLYQEKLFIVGMTGDGVNDAPALKKADIGIAMGQRGTQVAQDVADMVIKNDSFSSIVTAIKQGRIIFDNIRKFVIYLLSCNLSELFTIAVAAILNLHFQLVALQILFINLITDVLPALALGTTPESKNVMRIPPKKSNEPIINNRQWKAVIFYSGTISASSLSAVMLGHFVFHTSEAWNPELCNNILFFTLIGSQLLHVFNMNATTSNFFSSEIIRNKYVWYALVVSIAILILLYKLPIARSALSIFTLTLVDWLIIITFSVAGLITNQLAKRLKIIKP